MDLTSKQRLALAICDFLSTSVTDGTLSADDKDTVDVAINCISETFDIDPTDKAAVASAIGTKNLSQIYAVYENMMKAAGTASSASASSTDPPSSSTTTTTTAPTPEQKKEAEALKSRGNAAMAQKDTVTAIDLYTQALALDPNNAVYLSNRAAAHSAARDHSRAVADAEAATSADPKYTKGWSRLGLARFALGDARGALEAYTKGIEHEGNGGSEAMRKGYETAKRRVEEQEAEGGDDNLASRGMGGGAGAGGGGMPNLANMASMFGGGGGGGAGGGGGGGGGMPDLGAIMNNPMFASMAQNLMSNPDLMSNLMSNPRLREMANQVTSGGGLPNMSELLSDPSIAEMARTMAQGGAGRGSGSGAGGAGGNASS